MDFLSPLVELGKGLWGLASKPLGYICNLKDNVQSLRNETDKLNAKSKDVLARVALEEGGGGVQRTEEVADWLGSVQKFLDRGEQVLREAAERDRIKCLSRCLPRNCRSSYRLGKRVDRMLNEARELQQNKGEFSDFTSPLPPPPVLELPTGETVGIDITLNKVLKWLVDEEQVGVIGLYGTGGVGKTTLMKRINQELSHANHRFDIVIWVVVSRQVNEDSIRNAIWKRLHIQDERWGRWSPDERVHHLGEVLIRRKFVLLIDDVWQRLDLSNIGVPRLALENGSKVVFTTRLKHVCDQMRSDRTLEVQCLTPGEALKLFEQNVGKSLVTFHQEIQDLAKDVARECKGLPLALITVGRAMTRKDNPGEWRHALTTLRNNPHKLSGMVEEVYHILEYSYNSLNDSTLQACFLYCCLFPEDYCIRTDGLIELWIGEGLLGDTDDVYSMRDKGESFLGDLKRACLLESELDVNGRPYVKMHDVIRDMATWIACDHGQRENKWLVIEKDKDMSAGMISKWGEAEKVSLWGKWIQNINQIPPQCSQLETLLVRETNVSLVLGGFFDSMKACLTVVDLSENTSIDLFPKEICDLIYLQYLNLSRTGIHELPKEIKKLTCLRWLLLNDMMRDILIPTGVITSIPLNVFSLWNSNSEVEPSCLVNEEENVEELGRMQHLTDLSITVAKSSSTQKIFQSSNIGKCIRRVWISGKQNDLTSILWGKWIQNINQTPPQFSQLETLLVRKTNASLVLRGFFDSMKARLTVLDLSENTSIDLFPKEICDLTYLWYLNLSRTGIRELPKEIKKLTCLRWLLLNDMMQDILIPMGIITSLPLNVFSLWNSNSEVEPPCLVNEEENVEELGRMQHLTDLSITVAKSSSAQKIFQSSNIRKYIRRAWIHDSQNDLTSISISYSPAGDGGFSHLEVLHLVSCVVLREVEITQGIGRAPISSCFPNLVDVLLDRCGLPNLSWLGHAPQLRKLSVNKCDWMEKIIGDGFTREELAASGLFSRLERLSLRGLPKLTSICDHFLSFPQGVSFNISDCPGLRKLPWDSNDARVRSFSIQGDKHWWAEFEWDPTDRVTFQRPHGGPAEEMAFGEAVRKMKFDDMATIGFGAGGSGPTE